MNESLPQTKRIPARCLPAPSRDACLVFIYPTGPMIGTRYPLVADTVLIGRTDDCLIRIGDGSVSRTHARIDRTSDGYVVTDLGSTNGTFVNHTPRPRAVLADGDYLQVGCCIYRFLSGGNVEAQYHEEIYRMTVSDALTGAHNRRYLFEFLTRELARSARHRRPLAAALIDIDHFKRVNDRHGHLAGDMVLRELAALVREQVRGDELFARYGGEEFALVMPEAGPAEATATGDRLRRLVAGHPFGYRGERLAVTVSVGVAGTDGRDPVTPEGLIALADEQLYRAKALGRNRVEGGPAGPGGDPWNPL